MTPHDVTASGAALRPSPKVASYDVTKKKKKKKKKKKEGVEGGAEVDREPQEHLKVDRERQVASGMTPRG